MPVFRASIAVATLVLLANAVAAHDVKGDVALHVRHFPLAASDNTQDGGIGLATLLVEYWHDWDGGDQRFVFVPYVRAYDMADAHVDADVQELYWRKSFERMEISAGVRKYFWGKVESLHLVDVLNQSDLGHDFDGEDKLGQPVVDVTFVNDWGDLSFYVLPYFRERRFPASDARTGYPLPVADAAVYESGNEAYHADLAARWTHFIGAWDIGLSWFQGTARTPRLVPVLSAGGTPMLLPHYDQLRQAGVDVQATVDAWLWKLESVVRDDRFQTYVAAAAGFEYTFYGVTDKGVDFGVLAEYLYDERGGRAETPFARDIFVGSRVVFNDAQNTEFLFGIIHDPRDGSNFGMIEGSRRIGNSWRLAVEGRFFSGAPAGSILATFADDDYLEISLTKYF